ncbi:hypothetical protein CEXT_776761 [Caerostris extrusa]|uniref:Uncharacterized protein n=1 Tax=Caerostris extrusa TaxID=172846 RepID=A0AAV4WG16_CAEEX|nr:hypothetical protein CEXT_776761 [Caerostris extrusa]
MQEEDITKDSTWEILAFLPSLRLARKDISTCTFIAPVPDKEFWSLEPPRLTPKISMKSTWVISAWENKPIPMLVF